MAGETIQRPALEQAAAVRAGEVSARELVEASLAAIERLNGDVNAFVTVAAERALADADAIASGDPRPLAGVPIAIKDIGPLTEGIRTTFGSAVSGDWVPPFDTAIVKKLRAAGAVIVGKTSTPEFGITPVTEPDRFGPTRNPWDLSRTAGGSSGGSAAAVASGMVGLAHGNDGGGSIRIPASCCGLVGLKPSRGRVSAAPLVESPSGLVAEGVLTRTVADTAVALDVVAGYEWGDPHWPEPPESTFAEAAARAPGALRIGLSLEAPIHVRVHDDCVAAAREAASLLESLGHSVDESTPRWDATDYVDDFLTIWGAEAAAAAERMGAVGGGSFDPADTEPLTQELIRRAHATSGIEVLDALTNLRAYSRRVARWWADHDVLLTPTLAEPPVPHGSLAPGPGEPPMEAIYKGMRFVPFCPPANITGQPAISLPLSLSGEGLPVGVQLMGAPGGEELLLALAAQVEEARPWLDRRPALAAA
ncbi:MAG: amidase [Thermoleophilaceae bacterium]|jgi:amidase|nr:amidase [Thermoleophilaceae bacterium]